MDPLCEREAGKTANAAEAAVGCRIFGAAADIDESAGCLDGRKPSAIVANGDP